MIFGASPTLPSADSLLAELKKIHKEETRMDIYYQLGEMYRYTAPEKAKDFIRKSIQIAQLQGHSKLALLRLQLAQIHLMTQIVDSAHWYVLRAFEANTKKDLQIDLDARILNGKLYLLKDDMVGAMQDFLLVIEMSDEKLHPNELAQGYVHIAEIHHQLGNNEEALAYLNRAESLISTTSPSGNKAHIALVKGTLKLSLRQYPSAITYFSKAEGLLQSQDPYGHLPVVYLKKGLSLSRVHNEEHLSYLDKAIRQSKKNHNQKVLAACYLHLANFHFHQSQQKLSSIFLDSADRLAQNYNFAYLKRDIHKFKYEFYKADQTSSKALYHFQAYTKLKDSLNETQKAEEILRMEARRHLQEKRKEVDHLHQNKSHTFFIILFGIGIISMMPLIFWMRSKFFRSPATPSAALSLSALPLKSEARPEARIKVKLASDFMTRFNRVLEKNYTDPNFGIEHITKEMGLSRSQLHRKVKEVSELSPGELIRNYRIEKAKELLLSENLTISEIAYRVGQKNLSYFTKIFKENVGVTPTEYIKMHTESIQSLIS